MKFIKFLSLLIFTISLSNFKSQGVNFDGEAYKSIPDFEDQALGFSSLPKKFSLREYAPPVMMQKGNSCVGFAFAYSALSIMHNYKLGIKSSSFKDFLPFDPYFLYSVYHFKTKNKDCLKGTIMEIAIRLLKDYGCKRYFIFPILNCNKTAKNNHLSLSRPYRINGYSKFSESVMRDQKKLITKTKDAISSGRPVVIGVKSTNSMYDKGFGDGTVSSNGLWIPGKYEKNLGGHAVTIVGFDDNKFGGSVEIMNSWGKSYGDNGFMWVKYSDLTKIVTRAFIMEIDDYKGWVKGYGCKYGNCFNNYGQNHYENREGSKTIEEGVFDQGLENGPFIMVKNDYAIIMQFKNGKLHGKGYAYSQKEEKWYSLKYKNGIAKYYDELGFNPETISSTDEEYDTFIKERIGEGYKSNINADEEIYKIVEKQLKK